MKTAILITVSLVFVALTAHASKLQPIAVEDRGLDGEQRIYSVRCPEGWRVGIGHYYKEQRICYVPLGGKETCIPGDDLDAAAKIACQQSKPRKK